MINLKTSNVTTSFQRIIAKGKPSIRVLFLSRTEFGTYTLNNFTAYFRQTN